MIDLRSDTVTRPTPAIRRTIAEAEVGDDVLDGDPTVRRPEETVAPLFGNPRGLYFPTGTMANQAALWLLGTRGTEAYSHDDSRIANWEMAGAAGLLDLQPRLVSGAPVLEAEALRAQLRPVRRRTRRARRLSAPRTRTAARAGWSRHLPGLADDHRRARAPADGLRSIADLGVVTPDTNILIVGLPKRLNAFSLVERAREAGVLVTPWSATRIRCVLHLNVDDAACAQAVALLQEVLS